MDNYQHSILMKYELSKEDYEAIKNLEAICYEEQETYLKLELDFKMHQKNNSKKNKMMTEFFYYENEILVGYLGLGSFGRDVVEVTGMVHPKFRRKGIFKKLYLIAKEEWEKVCPSEVLVLCDHSSLSGLAFINSLGAEYASSEYKMRLSKKPLEFIPIHGIELRLANREDLAEINRQNHIYFGLDEKEVDDKKIEIDMEKLSIQLDENYLSYMAELKGEIIGKIRIDLTENTGFIYGFGVLPDFRGKGYGREILSTALNILKQKGIEDVFLEVATENKNALGLYESCGFEEISVMDYYVVC